MTRSFLPLPHSTANEPSGGRDRHSSFVVREGDEQVMPESLDGMPSQGNVTRRTALHVAAGSAVALAAAGLGALLLRERAPGGPATPNVAVRPTQTASPTPTSTATPTASPSPTPSSTVIPSPELPTCTALPPSTTTITMAWHGTPNERKVGITVDDFDHVSVVRDRLLDILGRNPDSRVTVFPIGRNIPLLNNDIPNLWRRLLNGGHEIGYHSLEHQRLAGATVDELREDIRRFNALIGEAVGDPSFMVRYARAPFGDHGDDPANFREIARELSIVWVLWEVIPIPALSDFRLEEPTSIQNGDIALFHDNWQEIDYLEPYMQVCRERGFEMVSLSGLRLFGD
jgi:peptidoglycan/xylan/chitin deacetylase (PgdA/CDA1 family)